MEFELNNKWKFCIQESEDSFESIQDRWSSGFDDSRWEDVFVPDDWSVRYPFDKSYSSGTGYLRGGKGWYRYHLDLTDTQYEDLAKSDVTLHFGGVYKNCRVWFNSYNVGRHNNGYTAFDVNVTGLIKKNNVIVVFVDHTEIADSRWYTGSGITRKVSLRYHGKLHFGPYGVRASLDSSGTAVLLADIVNDGLSPAECILSGIFSPREDIKSVEFTESFMIGAEESRTVEVKIPIENIERWSPENPALYDVSCALGSSNTLSDIYDTTVGFRSIKFDADKGFSCNDVNYKIKGVCVHEDAGCLGNAVPKEVWARRLCKLKSAGCNGIRMSHNPHCAELYDLCDELGFFVMDEIYDEWADPKNKWSHGHNVYPPSHQGYAEFFRDNYKDDVKTFVLSHINHPSIIMWSIGNEIDYPNDPYCSPKFMEMTGNNDNSKPKQEMLYNPHHPDFDKLPEIAANLVNEVKRWDTSRPVTMALAFPELSAQYPALYECLDVIGYNYKEHLYQKDHALYPGKPFIGSENGHNYNQWLYVKDNDYVSGQFLWTGIDYLGEAHGWPIHGSGAGILDLAGFEKDGYYFTKSLWSNEHFAYISTSSKDDYWYNSSRSWNYADGEEVVIRVYTQDNSCELFINNRKISSAEKNSDGYICFVVPYEKGEIKVKTENGLEDFIMTEENVSTMECTVSDRFSQESSDGQEEIYQIEVTLKDKNGTVCITQDAEIQVKCSGDAVLMGIENGNLADVNPYCSNRRSTYKGKAIVYVRVNHVADVEKQSTVRIDCASVSDLGGVRTRYLLLRRQPLYPC